MADGSAHVLMVIMAIFVVPQVMNYMPNFDPLVMIVIVMMMLAGFQQLGFKFAEVDGANGGEDRPRTKNGKTAGQKGREATSDELLSEADKCMSQNGWQKAEDLAKEVMDSDPENARAWETMARAQKWAGKTDEALATIKKARDIYELSSPGLVKLAEELNSSNASPEDAAREYEAKGEGFYEKRQYDLAVECYAKALEAVEKAPDAEGVKDLRLQIHRRRAECAQQLHDWSTCRKAATAILEAEPKDTKALLQRAAANEAMEKFQAALDDARLLRSLDPKNVAASRIVNNCQQALR